MSIALPSPSAIAARIATEMEAALPGLDARSPGTVAAALGRAYAMGAYDMWLRLRALADELLPDTATETLARHAAVWGVARIPASAASGSVTFTGLAGTVLPSGIGLRDAAGNTYTTQAGATIGSGGTATVAVLADAAGAVGNLAAGTSVDAVSPIAGVTAQQALVAVPGLAGGRDAEADEALRTRLLARIRQPPAGGAMADYEAWARAVSGIGYVAVVPGGLGPGTVLLVVALSGPAVAQPADVARVASAIGLVRPVTAAVTVAAATLAPAALTLRVSPDTAATRGAVAAALATFFLAEARIGQSIPLSRISEAISAASGEYSHVILSPTATIAPASTELPTLGVITWSA